MALNTTWTQFQGSPASGGYIAVRTAPAREPARSVGIESPGSSSPIVDPQDGAIYVAGPGMLQSFNPDLTSRWRAHVQRGGSRSTPAQDDAGRIYIIFGNHLVCFSRTGTMQWEYEPPPQIHPGTTGPEHPAFLFGTPKVWSRGDRTLVFVIFAYFQHPRRRGNRTNYLLALDERGIPVGLLLFHETPFLEVGGGGGFAARVASSPILVSSPHRAVEGGATFHATATPATGDRPFTLPATDVVFHAAELKPAPLAAHIRPPEPAPCIFQDALGPDQPIIVISDGHSFVGAFRWQDLVGFTQIWGGFHPEVALEEGRQPDFMEQFTSPAFYLNGWLAIGTHIRRMVIIDPVTGFVSPAPPLKLDGVIAATPASFVRQFYVVDRSGRLHMVDSNGVLVKSAVLGGESVASPLVTGTHVHVAAADGVHTFDFFLEPVAHFVVDPAQGMGLSSLAVGLDGTVYACSASALHAFPPP